MRLTDTAATATGAVMSTAAWLATYGATPVSALAAVFAAWLAVVELRRHETRPVLATVFCANAVLGIFGAPVLVEYFEIDHTGAVVVAAFVLGLMGHNALVSGLRALGARLAGQGK